MQNPRKGQFVGDKEAYWNDLENMRAESGKLPDWAFDFISVHNPLVFDDGQIYGGYTLVSPMFLVEKNGMNRLPWEKTNFRNRSIAIKEAKKIARENDSFVVYVG